MRSISRLVWWLIEGQFLASAGTKKNLYGSPGYFCDMVILGGVPIYEPRT